MGATVEFTDDTTTVTARVISGQWSPAVGRRNPGITGPRFIDVRETMGLVITGEDGAALRQGLANFAILMDQANKWYKNEPVSAVKVKVKMDDSDTTVEAVIWDTDIQQPANLLDVSPHDTKAGKRSDPFRLTFMRTGQLFDTATETETSTGSSGNPAIETTSSWSKSADLPSPIDFQLTFEHASAYDVAADYDIWVLISNATANLFLEESFSLDTNWTTDANAIYSAGTAYVTDPTVTTVQSLERSGMSIDAASGVMFFGALSNDSSSHSYKFRVGAYTAVLTPTPSSVYADRLFYTRWTIIEPSTSPSIIPLGIISHPGTLARIWIEAQIDSAGSLAADELRLDYLAGIVLDENATVLHLPLVFDGGHTSTSSGHGIIDFQHRMTTHREPLITSNSPSYVEGYPGYELSGGLLTGSVAKVLLLGTNGTHYVVRDDTAASELDLDLSFTRRLAYLTPP